MDAVDELLGETAKPKRKQPKDPERKSRIEDWYSEHDNTLGDGFELVYSDYNRPVGFRVDGGYYA